MKWLKIIAVKLGFAKKEESKKPEINLTEMSKKELKAFANDIGLFVDARKKKITMISEILNHTRKGG